ncbi:LysR family transcriptional regulator [Cupriavidus taiwanensis]|uniref:LysR family transcriptional regulator n=1 Tax=Cupriavidus taiwanensis TaxID=164546 RepID=UPI000E179C08|nr:LysR family transcriptional regulator [Cupriavidus taiwanensis]SPC18444.1 LysR family transcriptional regulator [Cupriavidus taiwanensis]
MTEFNRLHLIRQVDLFTLRLFLSAVEEQQIGRAASRENIAASTATKRIQDLEDIAGVKLLERGPKGVVPSPAGAVLVRYARQILDSIENLRSEISAFTEGMRGKVVVASARSIIAPFLARELGDYARDFPLVELVVREVENAAIIEAVSRGDADVGVFAMAHELELGGVDVTPYRRDRLVAVVPNTHALSARGTVRFEDLLPERLIPVESMLGMFRAAAKRLDAEFAPPFHVVSAGVAISLVQAGLGVTVLPECLLSHDMFDQVTSIAIDESWAVRTTHIATARGRALSPPAAALMKQLLDRPRGESAGLGQG